MTKRIALKYSDDMPAAPFWQKAERFALADRRSLDYRFGEPCDPRRLVEIYDVSRILETIKDYNAHFGRNLAGEFVERWSGVTLHVTDGNHLILINPDHSLARRTFTIAHEFGHLVFGHRPIRIEGGAMPEVRYIDEQEFEAYGYGLALLMPYAPLLQMLRQRASLRGIAYHYGVSVPALEMRLKLTGLWGMQL